ncbi:hypothetical protein ACMFMG_005639 [Clarireedia jacksonii]
MMKSCCPRIPILLEPSELMAPIIQPQPQPDPSLPQITLAPRQNDGQAVAITQTITRASTTFTTTVILSPSSTSDSIPAVVTISNTIPPAATNPSGPSSGVIAGAVLGSIFGFLFLCVLWYKCCVNGRSAIRVSRYDSGSDDDRYRQREWKSGNRGGGGREWEREHGVRRPGRVATRDREKVVKTYRRRSDGVVYKEERRPGGVVRMQRGGVIGWGFLRPEVRRWERRERSDTDPLEWGTPVKAWRGPEKEKSKGDSDGKGGLRFNVAD